MKPVCIIEIIEEDGSLLAIPINRISRFGLIPIKLHDTRPRWFIYVGTKRCWAFVSSWETAKIKYDLLVEAFSKGSK